MGMIKFEFSYVEMDYLRTAVLGAKRQARGGSAAWVTLNNLQHRLAEAIDKARVENEGPQPEPQPTATPPEPQDDLGVEA
jgi:hypothetical protein